MKQGDDPELDKLMAESDKRYRAFMKEYKRLHAACPYCGRLEYTSTLAGYTFFSDKPEQYKDENDCYCKCGKTHTVHERVPVNL